MSLKPVIINCRDPRSPYSIEISYNRRNNLMTRVAKENSTLDFPQPCPWVRIGNLYVSLTETGEESCIPLIKYYLSKETKISILSGRHGDPIAQPVDLKTKELASRLFDFDHYTQDLAKVDKLKQEGWIDTKVEDMAKYKSVEFLKNLTANLLRKNEIVIYAWCYSIFSMAEYDKDTSDKKYLLLHKEKKDESIALIVKKYFDWVPKNDAF